MERLTTYIYGYAHGAEGVREDSLTGNYCRGEFEATAIVDRLAAIEDILGDEYDLDHLKELVQADREQMYMEPGFHINIQNGNDCFQSWWLRNRESTKEREQDG